ncbi:LOW QUALITY PROTEIN: hypothetical protein T265_14999 [Opisthorchis viverrini]|uniref:Clusterin-associated protein 1 n=1 Tax=Opisthorchis viverrini TaxID=6198 RepID=A0A075A355_OPIVI|nr:LOW QUALITY PROTEIN: hypothetical protein T265_14999 [Opisthorchis viverrini]KER21829.1 LOW QUALITY PROTEIN: hypothetical protein T265_14999 [Opisthorchis viverrini]
MSYREMRTFTEMMRSLGYNRIISMENFRTPNFPLVAEILAWLVLRYDALADLPAQCLDTEQDRVIFIKSVAHFMATRANIRLNTKKLYQANGYAVKEMMKIATILYTATYTQRRQDAGDTTELCVTELFDVARRKQLQEGRSLASQLASSGASLHALLGKEVDLRESRDSSIRRQLDSSWVEERVAAACDTLRSQVQKTESSLINIAADEAALDDKIEKKRNELERNKKRLSTLQSVRPAYMEEYEQLEEELSALYSFYLTRFRNLAFLENQCEELVKAGATQTDDAETTLRTIAEHLKQNVKNVNENTDGKGSAAMKSVGIRGHQSAQSMKNGKFDDAQEEDTEEEEEDEEDLIDGQDDDDDDDDEMTMTMTMMKTIPSMMRMLNCLAGKVDGGIRAGRNQLAPGWSPSRQRIPAASYHGRSQRVYTRELADPDGTAEEKNSTDGTKQQLVNSSRDKSTNQVPTDIIGSKNQVNTDAGIISGDPVGSGVAEGKMTDSGLKSNSTRQAASGLLSKASKMGTTKDPEDEEDDDF